MDIDKDEKKVMSSVKHLPRIKSESMEGGVHNYHSSFPVEIAEIHLDSIYNTELERITREPEKKIVYVCGVHNGVFGTEAEPGLVTVAFFDDSDINRPTKWNVYRLSSCDIVGYRTVEKLKDSTR